jgi:hypothetical protein
MLKISNLLSSLKNFNKFNKNLFHTSLSVNGTQYYPINDEVFGLNEDQKQVIFFLNFISKYFSSLNIKTLLAP